MATHPIKSRRSRPSLSPWVILCAVGLLLVIVLVLAVRNYSREKRYLSELLSAKGAALIRAVEAGARTGMMGLMWGGNQVQMLLQETGRLPNVVYLAVTDRNGTILAHSNRTRVGRPLRADFSLRRLDPAVREKWHLTHLDNGRQVFEVYRYFHPIPGEGQRMRRQMSSMMRRFGMHPPPDNDWCFGKNRSPHGQIIFIGLDPGPFEAASRQDVRNTLTVSAILLLIGVGGFLSLFWAQNYRDAKRRLADTSAFADEVVTALPVGLITTDPEGRIAFVNAAAEKICGIQLEGVMNKPSSEVLPPELCALESAADRQGPVLEQELTARFPGRGRIPLSVSVTRIVNETGRFIGRILILRDLGEVKRLEEEIRRKEKLAALGSLSAGVAHEIRNPLSSIKGLAAYFGSKFASGSEDRQAADVMVHEVERLNRVVSELLDFARPSELNRRSADLNHLLDHSVRLIRQDAALKQVDIRLIKPESPPPVFLDPDRFSQCLLNLYLNAIDAMDSGGVLRIKAYIDGQRGLIVQVSDSGGGISADDLAKIFDPYYTTKSTGTGLGLAVVHKIVEAHRGRIDVQSSPNKGTTFTIFIPYEETAMHRTPSAAPDNL